MKELQSQIDEYKELEDAYDDLQKVMDGIGDNPIMIFSNNKAYYITHSVNKLIELLIVERQIISNRLVSLKQTMSKEFSKSENKQLNLI